MIWLPTSKILEELQLLRHHLQEPSVHGLKIHARTERITQLFRCGAQLSIGQSGQSRRVGFPVSQRMRRPLTPKRSETITAVPRAGAD
jgi:hypothetical protein